jgi:hypothetical protein
MQRKGSDAVGATKKTAKTNPDASAISASTAFDRIVAVLQKLPGVEAPSASRTKFGTNGLRVNGKIFAMLVRGELVVKLPREQVDALVDSGKAERFDPGRGKRMKEWATLHGPEKEWLGLVREAHRFVAGERR